jgi:Sap, sulfolipid-1-addressing protein
VVSYLIHCSAQPGISERRRERKEAKQEKGPPLWQRTLSQGSARMTFVVGALLTLSGGSYLIGLHKIAGQNAGTAATVGMVLLFNLIMLALLELQLLGFLVAPDWTRGAVDHFKEWFARNSASSRISDRPRGRPSSGPPRAGLPPLATSSLGISSRRATRSMHPLVSSARAIPQRAPVTTSSG